MYYSIILFFVCETNCFLIYFYELKKKKMEKESLDFINIINFININKFI